MSNDGGQDYIQGQDGFARRRGAFREQEIIRLIRSCCPRSHQPSRSQKKVVDKLIDCCARYTAKNFDLGQDGREGTRSRRSAAHLIEATRLHQGQAPEGQGVLRCRSRSRRPDPTITKAMITEMTAGREPTIASIAALVPRCYKLCKKPLLRLLPDSHRLDFTGGAC